MGRLFSARIARYAEADKPVLVVIDNTDSVAQCELLIPTGGRALVTSRNKLAALDARLLRLDILEDGAGADVLSGKLTESLGTDTRVADHRDDARMVAGLCGGLPLALRIVAAILVENPTRSLATVAADLRDARTRLDELSWEDGETTRGVRAAFDLSYRMLSPERAQVFRLLSANPGPEISTSAAAVLADLDERTVRGHLKELARTHLIEPGSADGRWRMHDLIRIYAAEEPSADTDNAAARLFAYYMNTANAATEHLAPQTYFPAKHTFAGRSAALAWLDNEYPNLAAIALLPAPMFTDVAFGLWRYFELRRLLTGGIMLTGHALRVARQAGDRDREARAHANLAGLFRQARMLDHAVAAAQAAAAIYRSRDDQAGLGIALNNLAAAQLAADRFEEAIPTGWDAVAVFQALGDRHREAIALSYIAGALRATGQHAQSITAHQNLLTIMRETGDQRGECMALTNLGYALKAVGQLDEAIAAEEQAVAGFAAIGDRAGEGMALSNLGGFLHVADQDRTAIPALRAAVEALTDVNDLHSRGSALLNLGNALTHEGHHDEAISAMADAAADFRKTRDRAREGAAELNRGQTHLKEGRPAEAAEALRAAAELLHEVGDESQEALSIFLLGNALAGNRSEEAMAAFESAVALFRKLEKPELTQAAMAQLLRLRFPTPSAAELRTRMEAGSLDQIAPGLWIDVNVLGGPDDEKAQKIAEDLRRAARDAVRKQD